VFCAIFAVEMLNDLRKHYTDQKPHIDAFLRPATQSSVKCKGANFAPSGPN